MAILLVLLVILAIAHFVIQSVIIPSLRAKLQILAFAEYEKLEKLKEDKKVSDKIFRYLADSLLKLVLVIPALQFSLIYFNYNEINETSKLHASEAQDINIELNRPNNAEAKAIQQRMIVIAILSFITNHMGLLLYSPILAPIVLLVWACASGAAYRLIIRIFENITKLDLPEMIISTNHKIA